jgi:hypothetical protein
MACYKDSVTISFSGKLALTSPTSGVGIVRSRTQTTEFIFVEFLEVITSICNTSI